MCITDLPLKPLYHMHAFRHHQEVPQSILDKEDVAQNEQYFPFHIPIFFFFFFNQSSFPLYQKMSHLSVLLPIFHWKSQK